MVFLKEDEGLEPVASLSDFNATGPEAQVVLYRIVKKDGSTAIPADSPCGGSMYPIESAFERYKRQKAAHDAKVRAAELARKEAKHEIFQNRAAVQEDEEGGDLS